VAILRQNESEEESFQCREDDAKEDVKDENHPRYINFIDNVRVYSSALAFASIGASISAPPGYVAYCFRIHGQIIHRVSPTHPKES
jgi:hypothetical protein